MELSEDELKPGLVLGRYELLAPVAKGGMAQVWAARMSGTRGFQKTVAIKTMLPNLTDDPQFEQMFLDEAALASRVRHPNAVEILDLGEASGILYLVMEWIDGEPLAAVMKQAFQKGTIPLRLAVRIVSQACAGLHAAHELKDDDGELVGLVHRDISPQNILVTYSGVVKVVDFGVAKATGRVSAETAAGQIKGKVPYMSPEQASGGFIDRRTDIFAMGILLYMMATGRHPFRKENDAQTLMSICSEVPIVAPSAIVADFPADLEAIILKSIDRNVDGRFQTAAEMQKALDALSGDLRGVAEDEVGTFMKELLPERMLKRQALIQRALKEAARRTEGGVAISELKDEVSSKEITPMSGVSNVSQLGRTGASSSTSVGVAVVSASDSSSPSGAGPSLPPTGSRRVLRTVVPLLLAGATGVGVYLATSRGTPPAPEVAAQSAPAAPVQPAVAAPVSSAAVGEVAPAPEASAARVVDMVLDEETEPAVTGKSSARSRRGASKGKGTAGEQVAKPAEAPKPTETAKPAGPPKPAGAPFVSPFRDPDF